jgi:hypothetical protein
MRAIPTSDECAIITGMGAVWMGLFDALPSGMPANSDSTHAGHRLLHEQITRANPEYLPGYDVLGISDEALTRMHGSCPFVTMVLGP